MRDVTVQQAVACLNALGVWHVLNAQTLAEININAHNGSLHSLTSINGKAKEYQIAFSVQGGTERICVCSLQQYLYYKLEIPQKLKFLNKEDHVSQLEMFSNGNDNTP